MPNNTTFAIDEIVAQHQIIYDVYFSQADTTGSGVIGALDAGNFLKHSKLKADILKTVWDLSDPTGKGYLDRQAFYIALKLISLSQSNQEVILDNINNPSPAPKLGELSSNITSLISSDDPWYIKASSRISYDKVFDSLSPINDKITGARVKPFLINSNLPVDVLGKIWELSDLDQDGNLDREEFLISMQLIAKAKEGIQLPDHLPPSLLPFKVKSSNMSGVNSPSSIGSSPNIAFALNNEIKPWVVSVDEKAKSDITFNQIDEGGKGYVTGAEIKDIFLKTGLSQMILANIWNLCDIGSSGKLNSEQFALAMYFLNKKLATGLDAPPELAPEMVPPSFRKKTASNEITIESKELEELQLQVTELQREKLYYEQRASEHDMQTRKKRTELSRLELEMESLFKTLQDREIKKVEEEKKLADLEDKLVKVDTELVDLKERFTSERSEIEQLKTQINAMEAAFKKRENDLNAVRAELNNYNQEQASIEIKLDARRSCLNEMNMNLKAATTEVDKNNSKLSLLKTLQSNLKQLLKRYEDQPEQSENELDEEIKRLEEENIELNKQIKSAIEATNNKLVFREASVEFKSLERAAQTTKTTDAPFVDSFAAFPSETGFTEDPFKTFDPFKDSSSVAGVGDPFRDESNDPFRDSSNDPFKEADADDPFAPLPGKNKTNNGDGFESDPFGSAKPFNEDGFGEDPFTNFLKSKESVAPPRPAPPNARAQTPSLKPVKMEPMTQRPQSSMDFTRTTKLDLFNDFNDPFQGPVSEVAKIPESDPFGNSSWDAFGGSSGVKTGNEKEKDDSWDPFG